MTSSGTGRLVSGDHTADGNVDGGIPGRNAAASEQPRLRADARRNRRRIVAAATRVFAELGPEVPMEEIARAAGVGVGTLYRRFPDRQELLLAVVQESMEALVARAQEAQRSAGTAWDRLVRSLEYSHELKVTLEISAVLLAPSEPLASEPTLATLRGQLIGFLDEAVRDAQEEGSVRPDVDTEDVRRLFGLLMRDWRSAPSGTQVSNARVKALVLDGLRCHSCDPLPTPE